MKTDELHFFEETILRTQVDVNFELNLLWHYYYVVNYSREHFGMFEVIMFLLVPKMKTLGIISNSLGNLGSPEALLASDKAEWRLMNDYDLLYCFRRDSNKIQNYLKILKCRIVPEHGC